MFCYLNYYLGLNFIKELVESEKVIIKVLLEFLEFLRGKKNFYILGSVVYERYCFIFLKKIYKIML